MNRILIRLFVLVGLVGLFVWVPAVSAQDAGVIEGTVKQAGSGVPIAGAAITLGRFVAMEEQDTKSAVSDDQGHFEFTGLNTGEDQVYLVQAEYNKVPYSSGMLKFEAGTARLTVPIEAYENSDDDSGVAIQRAHVIVRATAEGLDVAEMIIMSNAGTTSFVGKSIDGRPPTTVRLELPAGATNISFQDGTLGGRYIEIPNGIGDTQPIPPGESVTQIVVSYRLPSPVAATTIERHYPYAARNMNVLTLTPGWDVSVSPLTAQGTMGSADESYTNFGAQDLPAGASVTIALTRGASPVSGSLQMPFLGVGIGLGAALLLGLVTYPAWRRVGRP
jgi:hypothetical protein